MPRLEPSPLQLAVFDVDGTLTCSNRVDNECFVQILTEELGSVRIDTQWLTYTHVTDVEVTRQIFEQQRGRAPTHVELARLQLRFVALLAETVRKHPETCAAVPGAAATLARLRREPAWRIAIATGCWRASARVKLRAAGIPVDDIPLACAEDARARPGIVAHAITSAQACYGHARFERVVCIGDAVWDVHTARNLGLPLLGVCHDGRVERLRTQGVTHVIPDFTDFDGVLRALAEAQVPAAPTR